MPWNEHQAVFLRELGVRWVRGAGVAATNETDRSADSAQANPTSFEPSQTQGAVRSRLQPALHAPPAADVQTFRPGAPQDPVQTYERPNISGAGWAELEAAVSQCRACSLCRSRTQTVFGVGSTQSQWLLVGEAPGEQEDLRGEPFVGAAGRLLDRMLHALKLTRALPQPGEAANPARQVYIANTLKCRPPGNRNPQPEELQQCEPFLRRQLELLEPRVILAMGRFAVQSLLRSTEPIGKLRGRVHRYQGVPLVVTYHPAYLLRNPLDKAKAWADLCLAMSTFERESTGRATQAD